MNLSDVISVKNMRESDAHTIAHHTSSAELMKRAAQGIFDSVSFVGRVGIVCGKGNNGGDGYALACILCKSGITPVIIRASDGFSKDGLYFYKTALSLGAQEEAFESGGSLTGYDIIVDCLLGTGFSGSVGGNIRAAIEQINASGAFVVSADINSGINGDTGVAEVAVNSDVTVSIGAFKTGHFLNDAPYYIDLLLNKDIGIHLLQEEYKLIDYSRLELFEGYGSIVMSFEELYEKYVIDRSSADTARFLLEQSQKERKTIVVKSAHSAVIADLKYIYFCADYVK